MFILDITGAVELEVYNLDGTKLTETETEQVVNDLQRYNLTLSLSSSTIINFNTLELLYRFKIVDVQDYTEYSFSYEPNE